MADRTLKVRLEASDNVSGPLRKIADVAKNVGVAITGVGRQSDSAFDQVEKGAREAAQSIDKVDDAAKKAKVSFSDFDVAVTALGVGLLKAGDTALDQQQTIVGLQSAYGDAADEMLRFADEMASVTIFNDDDILRGERYFATLANNYDLTIEQVQQLMRTTADLASAYGTSFEDASSRITAAIRGEGEAAEFLGLTMNQQAIDRDNLTLSMSNQEAAQFRLNALYAQTDAYQGTAQRLTETEVGTRAKLTNALQDNAQAFAATIGPLTSVTAGMALTASGIGSMVGGLGRLATAARNSQRFMGALSLTFNPLTIGIGAAVAGGALLYEAFTRAGESTRDLDADLASLADTMESMRLAGETGNATRLEAILQEITASTDALRNGRTDVLNALFGTDFQSQTQLLTSGVYDDLQRVMDMSDDFATHINETLSTLTAEQQAIYLDYVNGMLESAVTTMDDSNLDDKMEEVMLKPASEIPGVMNAASAAIDNTGVSIDSLRTKLDGILGTSQGATSVVGEYATAIVELDQALSDGTVTAQELDIFLTDLDNRMARGGMSWAMYQQEVIDFAESIDDTTASLGRMGTTVGATTLAAGQLVPTMQSLNREAASGALDIFNSGLETMIGNFSDAGEAATGFLDTIDSRAREEFDAFQQANRDFIASMLEISGQGDFLSQLNMTQYASEASELAENVNDVGTSLDNLQRIIIGNTNALGSQMQGLADWIGGLSAVVDGESELMRLRDEELISQKQYNDAMTASSVILSANHEIQRDILAIQAQQAPILADNAEAMAEYVEQLRLMNDGTEEGAQAQLAALGWMDQGMQGQVQQFAEMMSMMNDMGPAGAAAMQQIVDGVVATNPALTAMLEELGWIEQQLDGSYTFNMDAAGAISDIEKLTASIDALTLAMGGTPPSYDIEVTGTEEIDQAKQDIQDLAALSAQERMIEISTKLKAPEPGSAEWEEWNTAIEPLPVPSRLEVPTNVREIGLDIPPVSVPVQLDFASVGAGASGMAQNAAQQAMGQIQNTVEITVTQVGAEAVEESLAAVTTAAQTIPDSEMVSVTAPGATTSAAELDSVTTAANAIPDSVAVSVTATGAATAAAALRDVASAANSIPANVSTTVTTNRVTNYSTTGVPPGQPGFILPGGRTGGIVGELAAYATGGMVDFIGGENGREMAHFATGGMASLPLHGVYSAPAGTYISPNNAVSNSYGGDTIINITVSGGDAEQIKRVFADEIIPAMTASVQRAKAGQGVRV